MGRDDYEMKQKGLSRGSSLFGTDPQIQLLNALRNRDKRVFRRLLSTESVDPDHCYDYPDYKTCLDIACSEAGMSEYVKLLVDKNVDVNKINETHHKAPLHFAAEVGDVNTLKTLLDSGDIDVNVLSKGNTALHLAIKQIEDIDDDRESKIKIYEDIIEMLVKAGTDVNIPDLKNITPIYTASKQGLENVVKIMIDYSDNDIDIDSYKDRRQKTARSLIQNSFPHLLSRITSGEKQKEITIHKLFSHISAHDEDNFLKDFEKIKKTTEFPKVLSENNGLYTMLQFACNNGMDKVVSVLLESKADPNLSSPGNDSKPIVFACSNGYYKILDLLLSDERTSINAVPEETLLQIVLRNYKNSPLEENCDYRECIKLLLDNQKECANINEVDIKGSTALHYAARNGDHDTVMKLLRKGACIGIQNKFNEFPIADMSPKTLETFLDECLTTNNERPNDDGYEIQFNYSFLVPPNNAIDNDTVKIPLTDFSSSEVEENENCLVPETDALLYMIKHPDLKPLLKHPVITSFLYLKWKRISRLFYANILFYFLFWSSLIIHILFRFENAKEINNILLWVQIITRYTTIIGLIFLIVREVIQLLVSPRIYLKSIENWLEMCLIVVTSIIMFAETTTDNPRQQLFAVAILLSSTELVLLVGQFPALSTNIVMLKTVSWNFFKFLLWYCILIVAFALSFYTLFRTVKPKEDVNDESVPFDPNKLDKDDDDKETDFFLDPGMSLFKTIVMLTGEFDAGSINFESFPVTSHIIFIIFVFMIPIVLFNLLNGLAVSDTQAIKSEAELVGHISRVQLIAYFENIILGDVSSYRNIVSKIQNACCWLPSKMCIKQRTIGLKCFAKNICLFPNNLPKAQIGVKVNQESRVTIFTEERMKNSKVEDDDNNLYLCCINKCNQLRMDKRIMKAAKAIISERTSEENDLKQIKKKLIVCEKKLENFEKLLSQIYDAIKNN